MTAQDHAFPARLRRRLTVTFVLVAGLSAGALAVGADVTVHSIRTSAFVDRCRDRVREDLRLLAAGVPTEVIAARLADAAEPGGPAVVVVSDGVVVPSIASVDVDDVPEQIRRDVPARPGKLVEGLAQLESGSAFVIGTADARSGVELYVFFPRDDLLRGFEDLRRTLAVGWLCVLAIAGLVGALTARRTLRPVRTAADAARSVTEGLLETRLPVTTGDEFGAWASAFNEMVSALEQKIDALAEASERERRLTADVAHELRTPLTAVLSTISHLRDTEELSESGRRGVEIALAASRRLERLTSELLELHRLEAGHEEVALSTVDVREAVKAAIASHGWTDRVSLRGGPEILVSTDRRRLDRIVVNLIANAIEHGGGDVAVDVTADDVLGAVVEVTDGGPGIPPEIVPRLFDRHFKARGDRGGPSGTSGASGGSGLGLAIVHESVALLGGTIDVVSAPGAGTVFRFTLPVEGSRTGPRTQVGRGRADPRASSVAADPAPPPDPPVSTR